MLTMFLSAVLSEARWTGACPVYLARWFPWSADRDSRQTALPGSVRSCSGSDRRPGSYAGAVRTASFFVHPADEPSAGTPLPGDRIDPGHAPTHHRRLLWDAPTPHDHHLPWQRRQNLFIISAGRRTIVSDGPHSREDPL